jgi:hypothetical protein
MSPVLAAEDYASRDRESHKQNELSPVKSTGVHVLKIARTVLALLASLGCYCGERLTIYECFVHPLLSRSW